MDKQEYENLLVNISKVNSIIAYTLKEKRGGNDEWRY